MIRFTRRKFLPLAVLLLAAASCRSQRTLVAPMVDLAEHARIGIVTFSAKGAKGNLAAFATQRFAEQLLRAQPGNEILEIGVVEGAIDAAKAKALGEQHKVKTIIVGELVISDVKPKV